MASLLFYCLCTVYIKTEHFSLWEEDTSDDLRVGRPVTFIDEQNILMFRQEIEENTSICELSTRFSRGAIESVIHKHLHKKRICARKIAHLGNEEQKMVCSKNSFFGMFGRDGNKRQSYIVTGDEKWI